MTYISGNKISAHDGDFSSNVALNDHKISFVQKHVDGKKVLDLGCVMHNPRNMESKYWLHRAIQTKANYLLGLDLYEEGVKKLNEAGYNVIFGDAQDFHIDEKFDVIVAADIIEHLHNAAGFFNSCIEHMTSNSKLLISTPNPWYWRYIVKAVYRPVTVNEEHTCWYCPTTLAQLSKRFGLVVDSVSYGSRYTVDNIMPLPKRLKHTSFHTVLKLK